MTSEWRLKMQPLIFDVLLHRNCRYDLHLSQIQILLSKYCFRRTYTSKLFLSWNVGSSYISDGSYGIFTWVDLMPFVRFPARVFFFTIPTNGTACTYNLVYTISCFAHYVSSVAFGIEVWHILVSVARLLSSFVSFSHFNLLEITGLIDPKFCTLDLW